MNCLLVGYKLRTTLTTSLTAISEQFTTTAYKILIQALTETKQKRQRINNTLENSNKCDKVINFDYLNRSNYIGNNNDQFRH